MALKAVRRNNSRKHLQMALRVVVFASEQLIPAISFVVHMWKQHGSVLHAVCIHHTHDEARSRLPALRLQRLLLDMGLDAAGIGIQLAGGDGSMASVHQVLHHWFCSGAQDRWVVDATGGTKPISAAAVEYTLAAEYIADRKALYLELGGGWGRFDADPDTGLTTLRPAHADDPDIPPADVLERWVPLELLTQTQHADLVQVRSRQLPMSVGLQDMCQRAMDQDWR